MGVLSSSEPITTDSPSVSIALLWAVSCEVLTLREFLELITTALPSVSESISHSSYEGLSFAAFGMFVVVPPGYDL